MTARQQYEYNTEFRKFLACELRPIEDKLRAEGIEGEESRRYDEIINEQTQLKIYFNSVETQNIKCWIGSRKYYKTVAKFGKTYYWRGLKMTKSNGYHCVTEIDEITQEMTNEMIDDSYYY